MTVPISDLQAVAPGAIIELFELTLSLEQHGVAETYRFHAGTSLNANGELVWNGNSYMRLPIEMEGFEYSGSGQLPRPTLRVSNIMGVITGLLITLKSSPAGGLEGAQVTRIRTLARYIDAVNFPGGINLYGTPDPTAEFPREIFFIDRKASENRDIIEFEMAAVFDLMGVRAPKRQCLADVCSWEYRSAECGYTGADYYDKNDQPVPTLAQDVCGKRLISCETRFNPFTRIGSVTSGSTALTVQEPVSAAAGTPIFGHGIATGATVASVNAAGTIITMSAAATANMTETRTGTIQSNLTTIVVSSASNLAKGMPISGPGIKAGTTITGIAGTTLTLSQAAERNYALAGAKIGVLGATTSGNAVQMPDLDGIYLTLPSWVKGPGLPADSYIEVTAWRSHFAAYPFLALVNYAGTGSGTYSFYYSVPYSSGTYTFTASPVYTFRNPNVIGLPYGGFPGIGVYGS
jgi:lambda family phage minor tail protein L